MKKISLLLVALFFAGVTFSQEEVKVDYVEVGVNENNPNDSRIFSVKMPDGSNANVQLKKRCFKEENLKNYSSMGWAADTEQLLTLISEKKKAGEYVKEMYEDNGVFYLLFHKDNKDRKSDKE